MGERVLIAGGPRTGKSTLAGTLGLPVRSTDSVIELGWSQASAEVAVWLDSAGPWCIEGVAVVRALRKWLRAHATGKPCDRVVMLTAPRVEWTRGQHVMAVGVATVWDNLKPELQARGVVIEEPSTVAAPTPAGHGGASAGSEADRGA